MNAAGAGWRGAAVLWLSHRTLGVGSPKARVIPFLQHRRVCSHHTPHHTTITTHQLNRNTPHLNHNTPTQSQYGTPQSQRNPIAIHHTSIITHHLNRYTPHTPSGCRYRDRDQSAFNGTGARVGGLSYHDTRRLQLPRSPGVQCRCSGGVQ